MVASEASSRVEFGSMPIQAQIHVPGDKDTVLSGKACYRCVCSIEALPAPRAESKAEKQRRRVESNGTYNAIRIGLRRRLRVCCMHAAASAPQVRRSGCRSQEYYTYVKVLRVVYLGTCSRRSHVASHVAARSPGRSTARRVLRGLSPKISRRGGLLFRRSTVRRFCSSRHSATRDRQPTTSFATRSISIPLPPSVRARAAIDYVVVSGYVGAL